MRASDHHSANQRLSIVRASSPPRRGRGHARRHPRPTLLSSLIMYPELFRIPGLNLPIYGYGVMLVIGFLLALELAKFLARRVGLDPELFVNCGLIGLISGIVGARLSHVIENWPTYSDPARTFAANFFDAVNIRSGGLTFYGGLILAFPACIAYGLIRKVPIRLGMDIIAPCVMVGLGIGRVGCFLNGC